MWIKSGEKIGRPDGLYQMAVCPQFDALSASSVGWGQVRGRTFPSLPHPQGGFLGDGGNSLTPVGNYWLSTKSSNPGREARDNMGAGLFRGKAGQVTTTDTNRLLESEESLE
jgi:hypothetical protein